MKKSLAIIICIAILILYFYTSEEQVNKNKPFTTEQAVNSQTLALADKPTSNNQPLSTSDQYADCKSTIKKYRKYYSKFSREQDWDQLLQQGYSIDDITIAITHFSNSNFASDWRTKQLRKNSQLTIENQDIAIKIKETIPELPSDFQVEKKVPQQDLANINILQEIEALNLINTLELNVDDIAWLLSQQDISQTILLQAIKGLTDINVVVGYNELNAIYLIDYAARYGHNLVVKQLLTRGAKTSHDSFLPSTMEWALISLSGQQSQPINHATIKNRIDTIQTLHLRGEQSRFNYKTDKQMEALLPRAYFKFNQEYIASILEQYQFNLTDIESRQTLVQYHFDLTAEKPNKTNKNQSATSLIKTLKEQRESFIAIQIDNKNPNKHFNDCKNKTKKIDNQWQPKPYTYFTAQLTKDNKDITAENLNAIHPILAECHIKKNRVHPNRYIDDTTLTDPIFTALNQSDITTAINLANKLENLTEQEKRGLFHDMLYKGSYYSPLQNSNLYQDEMYLELISLETSFIEDLAISGFDITQTDSTGKTLIFYAIKKNRDKVLRYLIDNGVNFGNASFGLDPLHYLLDSSRYKFAPSQVLKQLPMLMQIAPTIDRHHLEYMALIKLKYSNLYREIIEQFPMLEAPNGQTLPKAYCT